MLAAKKLINTVGQTQLGSLKVWWSNQGKTELSINGEHLPLRKMCDGIHTLEDELEKRLGEDLFLGLDPESIDVDMRSIKDSLSNTLVDYSFLDDGANKFQSYKYKVVEHILAHAEHKGKPTTWQLCLRTSPVCDGRERGRPEMEHVVLGELRCQVPILASRHGRAVPRRCRRPSSSSRAPVDDFCQHADGPEERLHCQWKGHVGPDVPQGFERDGF